MKKIIFLLLILSLLMLPCEAKTPWSSKPPIGSQIDWSHPLSRGLVGCWLMNEGAGNIVQDIARKNNGTNNGAIWVSSLKGKALSLNGVTNNIKIPIHPSLKPMREVTISAWVTRKGNGDGYARIAGVAFNDGVVSPYESYAVNCNNDTTNINARTIASIGSLKAGNVIANFFVTNVPIHTVFVVRRFGNAFLELWRNGVLKDNYDTISTSNIDYDTDANQNDFWIGSEGSTNTQNYNGIIDNVVVYNRALSPSEIQQLYAEPYCFIKPRTAWGKVTAAGEAVLRAIINIF